MKLKAILSAMVLLVIGVLFGAMLVSGFGLVRPGLADIKLGADNSPVSIDTEASSFGQAFIETADKVTPTIVQITVVSERDKGPHDDFFYFPFSFVSYELSGFFVSHYPLTLIL